MSSLPILEPILSALDGLSTGACLFDLEDHALAWNRTFLLLFPEHSDAVHVGEPYAENLRRFYRGRLKAEEQHLIERYVAEGVARHRAQLQPYGFVHLGRSIRVSSLPLPGVGRIRLWRDETPDRGPFEALPSASLPAGESLFDLIADGVSVADPDGRLAWVNEPFVRLYRLSSRQASLGVGFDQIYRLTWSGHEAREGERFEQGLVNLAEHLRFVGAPFELPMPQDRWVRIVEQQAEQGQRYGIHADITVLKRQQRELAEAERRAREGTALVRQKTALLEATLEHMHQGVVMINADRVVEVCNHRALELLDLPAGLMRSRPRFDEVLAYQLQQGEFARARDNIHELVRSGGLLDRPHVYDRQRPDGRVIEVHSTPIVGGGVLRTFTDISERRRSEERIRHLASHDGLTSLLNRDALLEQLTATLADAAVRSLQDRPPIQVAIHYLDLDGFKQINDTHGHVVGDKVLALVGQRIRHAARETDLVARMGGDEFAILQMGIESSDAPLALATRVLESLQRPFDVEAQRLDVGASIGVAVALPGEEPDSLLRRADAAMYSAKAAGRNRVQFAQQPS